MIGSEFRLLSCGKVQVLDNRKPILIALSKNQGHFRSQIIFCARARYSSTSWEGLWKTLFREKGEHFTNPLTEESCSSKWHSGQLSPVPNWKESGLVPIHKRGCTKILKLRAKKPKTLRFGGNFLMMLYWLLSLSSVL